VSDPLLGFDPPTRYVPKSPPVASRSTGTSPGVRMPLQRSGRRESTARQLPGRAPRSCRDFAGRSHPAGYGAAHRFSQPLSGLLPPSAVLPFSGRWRSWGCALQGFVPATQPRQLVAAGMPSWRSSRWLASPRPRWGNLWAHRPSPRFPTCAFCSPSGLLSAWESVGISEKRLASR
jgi:hypothetical protein